MNEAIGKFEQAVVDKLGLNVPVNTSIFIGEDNIAHMKSRHPSDYEKYGCDIATILSNPDYIGIHKTNGSIEYVKEYKIDNEFVKVAVRVSQNGVWFVRSLYILNNSRVSNFINKGTLFKL